MTFSDFRHLYEHQKSLYVALDYQHRSWLRQHSEAAPTRHRANALGSATPPPRQSVLTLPPHVHRIKRTYLIDWDDQLHDTYLPILFRLQWIVRWEGQLLAALA